MNYTIFIIIWWVYVTPAFHPFYSNVILVFFVSFILLRIITSQTQWLITFQAIKTDVDSNWCHVYQINSNADKWKGFSMRNYDWLNISFVELFQMNPVENLMERSKDKRFFSLEVKTKCFLESTGLSTSLKTFLSIFVFSN